MARITQRGQISLEFMLVFGILLILLLYSVNNVTFKKGTSSAEAMRIQISLEEKDLANAISNTITQVYAQGPGSKSTTYVHLTYLRDAQMLTKGLNIQNPLLFISYGNLSTTGNGTYVTVIGTGYTAIATGGNKTVFWSRSLYPAVLYSNSSVWSPQGNITLGAQTLYGMAINPSNLSPTLKIVVTWNPDKPASWEFDPTKEELKINIKAGG